MNKDHLAIILGVGRPKMSLPESVSRHHESSAHELSEPPAFERKEEASGDDDDDEKESEPKFTSEGAHFNDTTSQNCSGCEHFEHDKCELVTVSIPSPTTSWCQFHSSSPIWSTEPPESGETDELTAA